MTLEVHEYKKKETKIEAVQWSGSLDTVQEVIDWVLSKDGNASVNARFTTSGIRLEVNSQNQILVVSPETFLTWGRDVGLGVLGTEDFNKLYEVV